jgi:hypothetical protein
LRNNRRSELTARSSKQAGSNQKAGKGKRKSDQQAGKNCKAGNRKGRGTGGIILD